MIAFGTQSYHNDAIYTSADSGATWQNNNVYIYYAVGIGWMSVASSVDGSKLVAAASPGRIFTWQSMPVLNLTLSNDSTFLSWPAVSSAGDCVLQQNGDLSLTNWTDVATPSPIATNGLNRVMLSRPASQQYYRLMKR